MDSIFPLVTRIRNDTDHWIGFSVEEGRCPIPSLRPRGRGLVNLSDLLQICRRRRSSNWLIQVVIEQKSTGLTLKAKHFFGHVQISFRVQRDDQGLKIVSEGVKEKTVDMVFRLSRNIGFALGRNFFWNRRGYSVIALALLDFPLNVQQMRQNHRTRGKAPKAQQKEAKDCLKKRVCNLRCDVDVTPEAIVNSNNLTSTPRINIRKEEWPQSESDDSVKHIGKSQSKRKEECSQSESDDSVKYIEKSPLMREEEILLLDNDTDAFVHRKQVLSPERKPAIIDVLLDAPRHGYILETKMLSASEMQTLDKEENEPNFHFLCQQQLMQHLEYDHQPHSFHALNTDIYNHVFLFLFSFTMVGFMHVLQLTL